MKLKLVFIMIRLRGFTTAAFGRSTHRLARLAALAAPLSAAALAPSGAVAQATAVPEKIRDNLFLLEEAYNQEAGVVQHIQSFQRGRDGWLYAFTEEWPVPRERHQLSLTLPVLDPASSRSDGQLGDMLLNYRLQLLGSERRVAMAPRFSLVLPTGDDRTGAGRGGLGLQTNFPVSLDLHRNWVLHLNAGLAVVWLPVHSVNGVLEILHLSAVEAGLDGGTTRRTAVVVNPGLRAALDFDSGLQVVPGVSFPIEWRGGERRVSLLLYLSFEHPVWKPASSSGSAGKDRP